MGAGGYVLEVRAAAGERQRAVRLQPPGNRPRSPGSVAQACGEAPTSGKGLITSGWSRRWSQHHTATTFPDTSASYAPTGRCLATPARLPHARTARAVPASAVHGAAGPAPTSAAPGDWGPGHGRHPRALGQRPGELRGLFM